KTECQGEVEAPVYESGKVIYFERPLIECQSTFLNQPVVVNVIGAMAEGENLTFPGQPITVRKAGFAVGFITSSSFAKWPYFYGPSPVKRLAEQEMVLKLSIQDWDFKRIFPRSITGHAAMKIKA